MEVAYMAPEDYISKCIDIFNGPAAALDRPELLTTREEIIDRRMSSSVNAGYEKYGGVNRVENIANAMRSGVAFEAPWLEYGNGWAGQEGLHRVLAASQLGLDTIPVLVLKKR